MEICRVALPDVPSEYSINANMQGRESCGIFQSMQTLYFAIHLVVEFRADMSNTMDIALTNDIDDVSNQAPPANKEEDLASYRSCLMQREDLCQKEAHQHCSSCVGLFIDNTATGMKMGCGQHLR